MVTDSSFYQTYATRVVLALLVGAAVGALWTAGEYLLGLYQINGEAHFHKWAISKGVRVFLVSFVIWLIAITLFGGPAWYLLHKRHCRHWLHALAAGAVIPVVTLFLFKTRFLTGKSASNFSSYAGGGQQWENGVLTSFGWKMAAYSSAHFAIVGLVVGITIWFTAYRRSWK